MYNTILFIVIISLLCCISVHCYTLRTRIIHCYTLRSRSQALKALVKVTNTDANKTIEIEAGQPLSLACTRSDLRLSFQCKQGHCLSCEVMMSNKKVRACQTKVPATKSITVAKIKK